MTLAGAKSVQVPLDDAHRYDVDGLIAAVGPNTRSLIICNPNNPTGTMLTQEEVQRILDAVPKHVLVILDEAYREFTDADHDAVGWITEYSNLAIMRTFSKAYGLAGTRAGYLISNAGLSAAVQRTLPPFSLSATASAAALAAWNDLEHTAKIVDIASQERDRLQSNLRALGVDTPPSGGNFVWISAPTSARRLEELCVHEGVAVRAFDDAGVRITTGNADASDACVRAVTALIAERGYRVPLRPQSQQRSTRCTESYEPRSISGANTVTTTLITNISELTTVDPERRVLHEAAVVIEDEQIAWVGPAFHAPAADERVDVGDRAMLPGWVDSHTHLVFAGDRSAEFEARMAGKAYAAGGINVTTEATRTADDAELSGLVRSRVNEAVAGEDHLLGDQDRLRARGR